jgi:hypothetical protein
MGVTLLDFSRNERAIDIVKNHYQVLVDKMRLEAKKQELA